jgi:hypothetical protein
MEPDTDITASRMSQTTAGGIPERARKFLSEAREGATDLKRFVFLKRMGRRRVSDGSNEREDENGLHPPDSRNGSSIALDLFRRRPWNPAMTRCIIAGIKP